MSNNNCLDISLVPKDWSIIPCGVFFKEKSIKNTEGEMNLSVYRDYGVIPKDSRDDNHNRVSEDTSNYKLVEPGDFVINKMKGWSGSLGVSDYRGIVSPSYTVLEPVKEIHNKYFHYLLRSETYRQIYESLSYGVRIGQWELHYHDFKQIPSLYPPIEEQKLISRYLDKKTNQIDSLINKIEKKVELLKEQRASLIVQCVTKGFDSNVEMKSSGVKWIGDVPKHWEFIRLGYISNMFVGYPFKSEDFNHEDGIKLVRGENVSEGFLRWGDRSRYWTSSNGLEEYLLEKNDIVIGMDGSKVGKNVCQIKSEDLPLLLVQRICRVRIADENLSKWVYQSLRSMRFQTWVNISKTDPLVPHITQKNIRDFKIHLPPPDEMRLLLKTLSVKLQTVDRVLEKEGKRLELFKQYRQSLIFSVVTGKKRVTEEKL